MIPRIANILKAATFVGLSAFLASAANAQQQQQQQQGRQVNVSATGWYKVCSETEVGNVCNVQFQVQTEQKQLITGLNLIEINGESKRRIFRIIVPSGRSLPPGVQISVDGKQSAAIPYIFCRPRVCSAEVGLNDALVKVFKAGGGLTVATIDFQGNQQSIPVTLKGFTKAYDGPPVERGQNLAAGQQTLKEQLEGKVNATTE